VGADGQVTPLSPVTPFRTESAEAAYYVVPVEVNVAGTVAGQKVTLKLRAWVGDSFDKAPLRGESKPISITLGGGTLPPANLVGLEGFAMSEANVTTLPQIVEQPKSTSAFLGSTVVLSVKATGTGPLTYQWLRNGSPIFGANTSQFTLKNVQKSDEGGYSVTVKNGLGSTTSTTAKLEVKRKRTPGDFDDDGKPDLLLINLDRTLAYWFMDGVKIRSGLAPYRLPQGWEVAGSGDFNNDGKTDLLLVNNDGTLAFWFLDSTAITKGVLSARLPEGSKVAAVADFNNDDRSDLLILGKDGTLTFWLMDGTTVSQTVNADFAVADGWKIVGTGDFNKDGETDILLRHSNGALAFWFLKGTSLTSGLVPLTLPQGWDVIGTGDFNNDGQTDIMLRHSDKWLAFWFMDGTGVKSGIVPVQEPEGWQVIGRK
jgi:hypothetical protein